MWLSPPLFKTKWHPGYTDKKRSQKKVETKLITNVERRRLEVRGGTIHSSLNVLIGSSSQAPGLNVWFAPIHADQWLSEAESLAQVSGMQMTGFKSPLPPPDFSPDQFITSLISFSLRQSKFPIDSCEKTHWSVQRQKAPTCISISVQAGGSMHNPALGHTAFVLSLSLWNTHKHNYNYCLMPNFCNYGKWSSTIQKKREKRKENG